MRFGHFDDDAREYVITTPRTPYPWINYLGTEEFFGLVSHTGGGYCFYRDARLRRLTRYRYNNVPTDVGRPLLLRPRRRRLLDAGLGAGQARARRLRVPPRALATRRSRASGTGLRAEVLYFVPLGDERRGPPGHADEHLDRPRRAVKLFSFVEFCLWNACGRPDQLPAQPLDRRGRGRRQRRSTTRPSTASGATTTPSTRVNAPRGRLRHRPRELPRACTTASASRRSWPRGGRATRWPAAGRRSARTSSRSTSLPGEEKTFVFVLGYVENPVDGEVGDARRRQQGAARGRCSRASRRPRRSTPPSASSATTGRRCSRRYTVESGDERLDRMVNIWNPYQCMVTFNMSRSASYFETGIGRGMGFRDSNQDLLGFVHLVPERARERILDIAATQFPDGSAYHQYQPLTKRGNNDVGSGFNDDPLWLIVGDGGLRQGDRGPRDPRRRRCPSTTTRGHAAPLFEHLQALLPPRARQPRAARAAAHRPGRLERLPQPQLLLGDPGRVLPDHRQPRRAAPPSRSSSPACSSTSRPTTPRSPRPWASRTRRGPPASTPRRWRRRSSSTAGTASGSCAPTTSSGTRSARSECEDGQIFIEPQGFCVMAGIGVDDGQARKALDSVRERLDTRPRHRAQPAGLHRATTSSSARSAPTRRATRRTPASSATTTRG